MAAARRAAGRSHDHVLQVHPSPHKRAAPRRGPGGRSAPRRTHPGRRRCARPDQLDRRPGRGGRDAAADADHRCAGRHRHRSQRDRRAPDGVRAGHPRHRAGARRDRRRGVRRGRQRSHPRRQLRQDPRADRRCAAERCVRSQRRLRLLAAQSRQHREDRDSPGTTELDLGLRRHRRGDLADHPRGGRLARPGRGRHARHRRRLARRRQAHRHLGGRRLLFGLPHRRGLQGRRLSGARPGQHLERRRLRPRRPGSERRGRRAHRLCRQPRPHRRLQQRLPVRRHAGVRHLPELERRCAGGDPRSLGLHPDPDAGRLFPGPRRARQRRSGQQLALLVGAAGLPLDLRARRADRCVRGDLRRRADQRTRQHLDRRYAEPRDHLRLPVGAPAAGRLR